MKLIHAFYERPNCLGRPITKFPFSKFSQNLSCWRGKFTTRDENGEPERWPGDPRQAWNGGRGRPERGVGQVRKSADHCRLSHCIQCPPLHRRARGPEPGRRQRTWVCSLGAYEDFPPPHPPTWGNVVVAFQMRKKSIVQLKTVHSGLVGMEQHRNTGRYGPWVLDRLARSRGCSRTPESRMDWNTRDQGTA